MCLCLLIYLVWVSLQDFGLSGALQFDRWACLLLGCVFVLYVCGFFACGLGVLLVTLIVALGLE